MRSWTGLGVVALLVGFLPLGLLSLWCSARSIVAAQRGDAVLARQSSRRALVWAVVAIALTALAVTAGLVWLLTVVLA